MKDCSRSMANDGYVSAEASVGFRVFVAWGSHSRWGNALHHPLFQATKIRRHDEGLTLILSQLRLHVHKVSRLSLKGASSTYPPALSSDSSSLPSLSISLTLSLSLSSPLPSFYAYLGLYRLDRERIIRCTHRLQPISCSPLTPSWLTSPYPTL